MDMHTVTLKKPDAIYSVIQGGSQAPSLRLSSSPSV